MELIHFDVVISFFVSICLTRLYTLTVRWVATKKKGLVGWKATDWTRPLARLKGHCVLARDIWWSRTDREAPFGCSVER